MEEDYIYVEPENGITYLYINFTRTFIDAIKYNVIKLGRTGLQSLRVYVCTTANKPLEKPYKYVWITWESDGIKIKA